MDTQNGPPTSAAPNYGAVSFRSTHGVEIEGALTRLSRHQVTFELHNPQAVLRTSESLDGFKVHLRGRVAYSGRAVVTQLVPTGSQLLVEASVDEGWEAAALGTPGSGVEAGRVAFSEFMGHWQQFYRVQPEFKVLGVEMQIFLTDLRLWLEQIEVSLRALPAADAARLEQEVAHSLGPQTSPALDRFFERLEELARGVEPDRLALHRAFARRVLHPSLLCSPFLNRTYQKPLGYAGDYEMVSMMTRDPLEGESLFAKLVNLWFLEQAPALAHRNRLDYLTQRLVEVTANAHAAGRSARILSLGCGPAVEVQRFIERHSFSNHAHFTLIDFNQETLEVAHRALEAIKNRHQRTTSIALERKSVLVILKEASRGGEKSPGDQYDFVYCAGLFDYLIDSMCQRLSDVLFDWVRPGGLFVTTNVDASNPRRLIMDFVMDWHLIYRNAKQMGTLRPTAVGADDFSVRADPTGVNIYFEARKPHHA